MSKSPLVTVIVPVYNAENFLEKTVSSIRAQTYSPLEILLVDDGSKDDSLALCKKIAKKDARIRVLHKENGGAASARNLGVQNARGEYIGFVDSDDLILPDMYENMMNAVLAPPAEAAGKSFLVQIGREELDEEGNRLPDVLPPRTEAAFVKSEDFLKDLLLWTGDSSYCTKLTPRQALLETPFPEGALGEDFLLHMKMLSSGIAGVLILPATGYRVVHRRGSATRRANADSFSKAYCDIVDHADYVESEVVPKFPQLGVAAKRFSLAERLLYLLHVPADEMTKDNAFFQNVMSYLHAHKKEVRENPLLSQKERIYLQILTVAPKKVRQFHRALKGSGLQ